MAREGDDHDDQTRDAQSHDAQTHDAQTRDTPAAKPASVGRAAVERDTLASRLSGAAPKETTRRSCLLVDDSRMIRKVARPIIESCGFAVSEAENGEEALAKCRMAMPDLVLLDWDMPIMTGIEFLSALRKLDDGDHPKVVFCTSKSESQDIAQGITAGADEYMTKPFDQPALLSKLKKIGAVSA